MLKKSKKRIKSLRFELFFEKTSEFLYEKGSIFKDNDQTIDSK